MEVMNLVIQIVNKIIAKALNHRQFCELLDEIDSEYSDFLLHNYVCWLSRGEELCCFVACLEHVKTFLKSKNLNYPTVFARNVQRGMLSHFPALIEFKDTNHNYTLNGDCVIV